jgi:aspartyl aminopeptidase
MPILGLVADQLNSSEPTSKDQQAEKDSSQLLDQESRHHPLLLAVLADELECSISDIQDFEL